MQFGLNNWQHSIPRPIHPTAVVALEWQQSLSNQAKIAVANTPQERANLERFDKKHLMDGKKIGRFT